MSTLMSNNVLPDLRSTTRSFTELKLTPVILVCIHNVGSTPITHDLLHTVFSTYGKIFRILIFEKTKKWKAFVEYDDPQAAVQARENLDDFLLFSDGTRMNIYPSNLPTIKFQNNNSGGIDYTLIEEQPLFTIPKPEPVKAFSKKFSDDGSNGNISPDKKISEHNEETHYKSTSADTGSHSHSAHHSVDDEKEDEILQMIEEHKEKLITPDYDDQHSEEENDKDTFNDLVDNAFVSFKFPSQTEFPNANKPWNPEPFFNPDPLPIQPNNIQKLRSNNSFTHIDFNHNSYQPTQPIARAGTFGELPTYNTFSTLPSFGSSNNIPQSNESLFSQHQTYGMNPFSQMKSQLNPKFPSQPELSTNHLRSFEDKQNFIDNVERDLLARIMSKIQSPEFQEYTQMNKFNPIEQTNLSQMDKETLLQLYSNLSTIVGKDSDSKKCAVLHVNGLENTNIKVQMLYNVFSNFGNITKIIFMKSKASALIEFENSEYAGIAKDYLNNIVFMGKPLRINYSNYPSIQIRNKQNKGSEETFTGNQRNFRFNKNKNISINPPSCVLHISNLIKDVCKDESVLRNCFGNFGKVDGIKFLFGDNGKNMCLLKMPSIEDALRAMAYLHDSDLGGRRIQISFTRSKI